MKGIVVAFLLLAGFPATASASEPSQLSVMEYLGQRATRMATALPAMPDDLSQWERRRKEVRAQLTSVLGLPAREPMRARTLSTRLDSNMIVEDVMYLWAERAYVSANVVRSVYASVPLPALVMPPGWLGEMKQKEYYTPFVYEMVRRGFLVIFIDDPHVARRLAPYAGLYGAASAAGTQVMGIQVFDTLRAFDYLLTRHDVDPQRIGVAGLCQGSEQTWLAAALEDRFQIAVPVCGTTTYEEWVRMPVSVPVDLSDPSPYVQNVLRHTDWHEINACIAPRPVFVASNSGDNWWPRPGYDKVITTLERTFRNYGQPERFKHLLDLRSHSLTPFMAELVPWIEQRLGELPPARSVKPKPADEPVNPDFSMLRYVQRQIEKQTSALPASFKQKAAWENHRAQTRAWLRQACDLATLREGPAVAISRTADAGLVQEVLALPQDAGLSVPVTLFYLEPASSARRPAVVLSHDSAQCMADADVQRIATTLAKDGFVVCVPEHASTHTASQRRVTSLISLYGAGDTVSLPPLALRAWDDVQACRHLRTRPDVDAKRIAIAGLGLGGVDAAVAAALDEGSAALGSSARSPCATGPSRSPRASGTSIASCRTCPTSRPTRTGRSCTAPARRVRCCSWTGPTAGTGPPRLTGACRRWPNKSSACTVPAPRSPSLPRIQLGVATNCAAGSRRR